MSSLKATIDGFTYTSQSGKINVTKASVTTKIKVYMSEKVTLIGTPIAKLTYAGVETEYGSIILDTSDPSHKTLIITPNGSNGTAVDIGTLTITIPEGSVKDMAGNRNAVTEITVTITEPLTIAQQFPDAELAKEIAGWLGVTTDSIITWQIIEAYITSGHEEVSITSSSVMDLTGFDIFYGTSLKRLTLYTNATSFDASGLLELTYLDMFNGFLTSINLHGLQNLTELYLGWNYLETVDVSGLSNLSILSIYGNKLTTINLSGLTNLTGICLEDNQLTTIDLSGLTSLTILDPETASFTLKLPGVDLETIVFTKTE